MNNSKLVNVLRTFSKNEMKEFEKLVSSPYFNKGRNYIPFLSELKKFYPKFDNDKMTPEYIYSKLYPGKKFNKQIIWNMNSALLNIAEEFLIHVYLKKNNFERNCHAADELHDRKLSKLYNQKLDTMEHNLKRIGLSEIFFQNKMHLELRRISLYFGEDRQHFAPALVIKKGESLILNFLIIMANVITNMNYNALLYNARYDINIPHEFINSLQLDRVINYAKSLNYEYAFVMEMYYCLIMTVLKPTDTAYFLRAKELYENNSNRFDPEERDNFLGALSNYCIYRLNNGEADFGKMLFEVNKLLLKKIDGGRKKEIGKTFYMQIFRNALIIQELDWAKTFIEKYTSYLKHGYQKTMRSLADAFLAFKLKDYGKVIESLSKVKFIDSRDKFYVKSLSLRAYYELGEIPTLIYYIDSAKQFVSKNPSLGKLTRRDFNNFLICLKKLLALKEKNDFYELEKLKKEIEKDRSIINGGWLLEKIAELGIKSG